MKKIASLILVLALLISVFPVTAQADEIEIADPVMDSETLMVDQTQETEVEIAESIPESDVFMGEEAQPDEAEVEESTLDFDAILALNVMPDELDSEDPILDYGTFMDDVAPESVETMGVSSPRLFEMADVPKNGSYKTMHASQKMIDIIKDFEGFSSKAYWDNTQWTVGYGTRCADGNVTVTRAEAETLLRKVLISTYEPVVIDFCKKNGKQPTQQQFDAMLDLTYNAGGSWTTGSSVPDAVLNPTSALDVVKGFGAWSRSGGKVSYVHVNRRIREALIYLYGEYYLAYGNQDCKSGLKVVDNDDLPHFKVVIFKTSSGTLSNGKTDYAAYYPVGDYYRAFIEASRSDYTLTGWKITKVANDSVSDAERASIWDRVEENLELTAVWEKGTFTVKPEEPPVVQLMFKDVPSDAWFYDAVNYVYSNGLMNGTSKTTFAPASPMSRGMLVTVLYRMEGSVAVAKQDLNCFKDVPQDAYYANAIAWAYKNKIVSGTGDGKFAPDRTITRQEAITIFHRYCTGGKETGSDPDKVLKDFSDRNSVVGFAVNAFTWAVETGIVEGSGSGSSKTLNPTGALNRAQAAVLLQRCAEGMI